MADECSSPPSVTLGDYKELFINKTKEDLELIKKSLKPPTRPSLPHSEVYLDGCFTCSGDQLAYVVSPLYISLQREWFIVFQYLLALCPTIVNKLLPTVKACDVTDVVYCSNSETLLHLACRKVLVKIIKDLLVRGASTEIRGCKVGTPLHVAAEHGKLRAMKLLLASGADIEARDSSGNTPLLLAAESSMLAGVRLLLKRGADITAKSYFGHDLFSIAIRSGLWMVLTEFLDLERHAFLSKVPGTPPPLLLLAAFSNNPFYSPLFKRLVDHRKCPPQLKVDASLISASCTVFTSESIERVKNALRLKEDLQVGPPARTLSSSWYGEYQEVSSVQEWEEMQPEPQDYYLQGCLILERCLGSDHPIFHDHLTWLLRHCAYNMSSKLSLRCLDMFIRREEMKLDYCNNASFEVTHFNNAISHISGSSKELVKLTLKGLAVCIKLQERHSTCTFFKTDPTPYSAPCIYLMSTFLTNLCKWIDSHLKIPLDIMPQVQIGNAVESFVRLSHSALNGQGVFNIAWWPYCPRNETERYSLVYLLVTLLKSGAVSRINIPEPLTGVRPLHYFFDILGKIGVTLLLSYGAHLDVASRGHPTLRPGRYPLNTMARYKPRSPVIRWILRKVALVPDVPVDTQLSSPLPLLCQCSWAILREKIPYRQFHLPSRIKDYIALHEIM